MTIRHSSSRYAHGGGCALNAATCTGPKPRSNAR